MAEPRATYRGEKSFPLIMQNVHRYFLYVAILFIGLLSYDAWKALWFANPVTGQVLKTVGLAFSPACLRVDRSDGSVWVTGGAAKETAMKRFLDSIEKRTGKLPTGKSVRDFLTRPSVWSKTHKYDQNGVLQCEIGRGGYRSGTRVARPKGDCAAPAKHAHVESGAYYGPPARECGEHGLGPR